ncbi:sn-glycerol-3-phosphate import ATP-binding protein UgpC [Oryzibacter oryziterrae]|uniref:sn-glycerol-3-phosphate import ATP-binding protein UgpC n=1 Tax=Oryzibacter oryziterrae TaxID=2766474 RepID=UPI001F1C3EDC|nr:sn-glycerol-3-phosphate import ATP-binding protein UgpC [Oryzibacter oryziterrae]
MGRIHLEAVRKTYAGNLEVVKGVDLDIADGEFIVLVGPSGCGKSTLLRMIAGLETITSGTITIGERVVNKLDPADRNIAMVFQNYALYPHMSVYENLAYGLRNHGTPKSEIEARVQEAARMLQLEPYLTRKPRALSGGQRQRVAMGRAIVRKPDAFLFDEPLSNLDAKLRVSMRGEIRQLQRRLGTTAVYVTHDQLEAMTLADRLVVLNGGQIEQIGTPLEVYHAPASTFVAGFIGSPAMNLLPAEVSGQDIRVGQTRVASCAPEGIAGAVTLGVRPEDVTLARDASSGVSLKISYIEELGAQRLVHGTVEGQQLTMAISPSEPLSDTVEIAIASDKLHFFGSDSGARLNR